MSGDAASGLAGCLRPLVEQLDPRYRDAIVRVDLEGRTHRAVAEELGVSVSGMKSRVQRGRRQLRALLTDCCAVHLDRTGAVTDVERAADRDTDGATPCGCEPPSSRSCGGR
ncbi:MAG: sigma factor-like helix-turn-helix DNA-binding protein [Actinomycetota bacterium]|nr:sigma factor-like helix-turn-helix DNA-binding protein [Actinomycetota bacterium]